MRTILATWPGLWSAASRSDVVDLCNNPSYCVAFLPEESDVIFMHKLMLILHALCSDVTVTNAMQAERVNELHTELQTTLCWKRNIHPKHPLSLCAHVHEEQLCAHVKSYWSAKDYVSLERLLSILLIHCYKWSMNRLRLQDTQLKWIIKAVTKNHVHLAPFSQH